MLCYKCGKKMKNVLHFDNNREYQTNWCPQCRDNTKKKRIHYEDIIGTNQNNTGGCDEDEESRAVR